MTLAAGEGAQLIPAAVPIVLLPTSSAEENPLGVVRPGDAAYEKYRSCVDRVTRQGYVRFAA